MSGRTPRRQWTFQQRVKNDVLFALAFLAIRGVLRLPRAALAPVGRLVGRVAHRLLGRSRRLALRNLRLAYAELSDDHRRELAREVFQTLGVNLLDTLALLRPEERCGSTLCLPDRAERTLRSVLERGRGVIYITSHLGPWERMAGLLCERGFPITTVARESYDPRFHRLLYERVRADRGVRAIYRGQPGAPMAIVRALRAGRVVGFLVDLPGRVPVCPVSLLGTASRLPIGPARIALRTRSPIVVGTPAPADVDAGARELALRIEELPASDLAATPEGEVALVQRIADALSDRIRALPTHWPWMHPSFE